MNHAEECVRVAYGVPVRSGSSQNKGAAVACGVLVGVTTLFTLLGCVAALSSDPKNEAMGERMLKVAKATGDVAKSVCRC